MLHFDGFMLFLSFLSYILKNEFYRNISMYMRIDESYLIKIVWLRNRVCLGKASDSDRQGWRTGLLSPACYFREWSRKRKLNWKRQLDRQCNCKYVLLIELSIA